MTSMEHVLAGILIAVVSAFLGIFIGSKNKVNMNDCSERRVACIALIDQKLTTIAEKLDLVLKMTKANNVIK